MNLRGLVASHGSALVGFVALLTACSPPPAMYVYEPPPDLSVCPETCGCGNSCYDAGPPDLAPPPPPQPALFAGKWSPIAGTGEANCGGQTTPQPPNPYAVLTFTPDSGNTLMASSSGVDCPLELIVVGTTASLKVTQTMPYQTCSDSTGAVTLFSTFNLVFVPASQNDGGLPQDTLDWTLGDAWGSDCDTTLHYTLAHAP